MVSRTLTSLVFATIAVAPATAQRGGQDPQIKPYTDVVTDKAQTKEGVFKVHKVGSKLYFEIPSEELGKDFLWVTTVAGTPEGGYGGTAAGDMLVYWERVDERVLLRQRRTRNRAVGSEALSQAVALSNVPPIIMAFGVEALSPAGDPVIEVTGLYTSNPPEFDVSSRLGVGSLDAGRTFLENFKAFETNIEVRTLMTFRQGSAPPAGAGGGPGGGGGGRGRSPSNTALVNYSLVRMPDRPMMGRLFDDRVGYFSETFIEYGAADHVAVEKQYIARYRLEKKNPNAAVSDPVKPIVYYVSREVPEKWRPYVKQGIEDWKPAFEAAGFSNAIVAMDPPSDPTWDPEDARFSVVRWAPNQTQNAMGPHYHDPRSGEIVSAHIIMWHDSLKLVQRWYFSQASASDPRAQQIPFPEELIGRLLRYVVAHEVGHTLGLQHNFKGSAAFTIANLRDRQWTERWGTEASIMDYGRFNYVAQPEDRAGMIPQVAQYDHFAIKWGYTPIRNADTPEKEKPTLDAWTAVQVDDPKTRFSAGSGSDPSEQSEDLGDDGIEATRLGLMNIERIMEFLFKAATKPGEDYTVLDEYYGTVWGQRNTELNHTAQYVGGVVAVNYHAGRGGNVHTMVPRERQQAAVQLLVEKCFETPHAMLKPEIMDKLGPATMESQVNSSQTRVLSTLLADNRLTRMLELEAAHGARAYPVGEMFSDLRRGIWHELDDASPTIDPYRMRLQVAHVMTMVSKLSGSDPVRGLARVELATLRGLIGSRVGTTEDWKVRAHLADLVATIDKATE